MTINDKLMLVFYDSSAIIINMKNIILSICVLLLSIGCQESEEKGEYEQFYFPYESLEDGLIYEYESTRDTAGVEYWFYKSLKDDQGWHLTGTYYDAYFQIRQFFREEIYSNGSVMVDYFLYQPDSLGEVTRFDANIKAANGFPFALKDTNSVLLFDLEWTLNEEPLHKISLTRNRQYREKTTFAFQGRREPAVVFDLRERVDDEQEGHLETEYTGMEVYAKGIGLVYYRKEIGEELQLEYQLKDVYSMLEFEKKFKEVIK